MVSIFAIEADFCGYESARECGYVIPTTTRHLDGFLRREKFDAVLFGSHAFCFDDEYPMKEKVTYADQILESLRQGAYGSLNQQTPAIGILPTTADDVEARKALSGCDAVFPCCIGHERIQLYKGIGQMVEHMIKTRK